MRHRWSGRKLGRDSAHRKALLRNMVTEFLDKGRIITTVPKAKELRPFAEKLISLGKRETLHARRRALRIVRRKSVVHKLFDSLAPRYADRQGGYTRIIRLGFRKGDSAEMALIELVGSEIEESSAEEVKEAASAKEEAKPDKVVKDVPDKANTPKSKNKTK